MTSDPREPAGSWPQADVGRYTPPVGEDSVTSSSVGADAAGSPVVGPDSAASPLVGADSAVPAKGARPARRRRRRAWIFEWAAVILIALVVAVVVRTFVLQTFYIPSGSMEPTLDIGDRILVDKLSYDFHPVHQGDIIVFRRPPGADVGPPTIKDLVKRVIGLPGQTISSHGGQVYINGKLLPEPWLPPNTVTTGIRTQKIPPGEYFVMGDNRTDSLDSRYFGPIPGSLIVGRVVARIWPLSRFKLWF
ncbi:MAG: signal peptidase I [Actinobacteria bacterium]|nr:signal peptidase I [Actinomycetota bacterium]